MDAARSILQRLVGSGDSDAEAAVVHAGCRAHAIVEQIEVYAVADAEHEPIDIQEPANSPVEVRRGRAQPWPRVRPLALRASSLAGRDRRRAGSRKPPAFLPGHEKEAKEAVVQLRKLYPDFTVQTWAGLHWSDDPTFNAQ